MPGRTSWYPGRMEPRTAAVLLDIDGTLVDSTYHHALAWHRAFVKVTDDAPPLWRLHRTVGMGGDKLVAEVAGEDIEESSGDDLRAAWRDEYTWVRAEVRPLPGAADMVRSLADAGYRVALASSGDPQFSREAVDLLDVGDAIELLTTSADVEDSKPDPDLVGETLRRLDGVEHGVLVGDTVHDVESARRAGIGCVGLLSGGYSEGELTEAGAVRVAGTPADLQDAPWPDLLSPL